MTHNSICYTLNMSSSSLPSTSMVRHTFKRNEVILCLRLLA
nr:MAG TPA: hypothetical protein [Caudoviricetes sp.]